MCDTFSIPADVCPTYVGMNRRGVGEQPRRDGMPHVCGDELRSKMYEDMIKKIASQR